VKAFNKVTKSHLTLVWRTKFFTCWTQSLE